MQKEIEYLGYTLSTEGVKPQKKKVEAMQRIKDQLLLNNLDPS